MGRLTESVRSYFVQEKTAGVVLAPASVPRRGFEAGIPAAGITEATAQSGTGMGQDRPSAMSELYDVFLACPWSWAATNAIARTITGGGLKFKWDNDDGEGDQDQPDKPTQVMQCERLLKFTNPREDIIQLCRSTIADLEVFGDGFIEVVWAAGIPVALYTLDCPSTTPLSDSHGNITGYVQITEQGQRATFEPHEVIHISLDAPRSGIFGVSPTFAALQPIKVWLFTMATLKEIFRKGMPPSLHVDLPGSMSSSEQGKWIDQYMTRNVGPLNIGRPVVTKGEGVVKELQQARIDELLHVLDQQRDAILASYGCPPAEAGVIESGNLGGGTGEAQHRQFMVNTCGPIAALLLEKLNFVLLGAFGITDWSLHFEEVDLRDSAVVETIRDQRIKNGTYTVNRARAEIGEPPIDGGEYAALVLSRQSILWRDMAAISKAEIAKQLGEIDLRIVDPQDDDPAQLERYEPPAPPPLAPFAGQDGPAVDDPAGGDDPAPPTSPPAESSRQRPDRPVRESWAVYSARIREAMKGLPHGRDDDTAA